MYIVKLYACPIYIADLLNCMIYVHELKIKQLRSKFESCPVSTEILEPWNSDEFLSRKTIKKASCRVSFPLVFLRPKSLEFP